MAGNSLSGRRKRGEFIPFHQPATKKRACPAPPKELSPIARQFWLDTAHLMHESGVLQPTDLKSFGLMAETYADFVQARHELQTAGYLATGSKKQPKACPWFSIMQAAQSSFMTWASAFGCTPLSRSRLRIEPPEIEDEFSRI